MIGCFFLLFSSFNLPEDDAHGDGSDDDGDDADDGVVRAQSLGEEGFTHLLSIQKTQYLFVYSTCHKLCYLKSFSFRGDWLDLPVVWCLFSLLLRTGGGVFSSTVLDIFCVCVFLRFFFFLRGLRAGNHNNRA